jgi:hypothetical protein
LDAVAVLKFVEDVHIRLRSVSDTTLASTHLSKTPHLRERGRLHMIGALNSRDIYSRDSAHCKTTTHGMFIYVYGPEDNLCGCNRDAKMLRCSFWAAKVGPVTLGGSSQSIA